MTTLEGRDRLTPRMVVAIPVCNEAERIGACLRALNCQEGVATGSLGIVLFLNACTDGTQSVVGKLAVDIATPLRIIEGHSDNPSAGWARRRAMEAAHDWLLEAGHREGILLTTDADSRVGEDWVALNAAAIATGADAVAGRIALDCAESAALPDALHARGRLEAAYEALLTEIGARLDPEPGNPWPCHWGRSGATIAVKASAYRAVGGMPELACGEDRAFIDGLRAAGFIVRHAPRHRSGHVRTAGRSRCRRSGRYDQAALRASPSTLR